MALALAPQLSAISLQLTDACNLACSYCYYAHKKPIAMATAVIDDALRLYHDHRNSSDQYFSVIFFGGEPFMAIDNMTYAISLANEYIHRHYPDVLPRFSVTTNGTLFSDAALTLCRQNDIRVQLSLDGAEEAHDRFRKYKAGKGSFATICDNLHRLKDAPGFRVRMTTTPETIEHLPDGIDFLIRNDVRNIAVSPVMEANWDEASIGRFEASWRRISAMYIYERMNGRDVSLSGLTPDGTTGIDSACRPIREFGCGAATTFAFVDMMGDLYPCHRYPGYFDRSPAVRIGHVSTGFDAARRAYYVEANRGASKKGCGSFLGPETASGRCGDCVVRTSCGGSCMAVNQYVTGNPSQPHDGPGRLQQILLEIKRQTADFLLTRSAA